VSVRYVALVACVVGCSAELPAVQINEFSPANMTGCADVFGVSDDWIELVNTTTLPIDLGGYRIYDEATPPADGAIPSGVTIPPRGYLLLWADGKNQGLDHLVFKLGAGGDRLTLESPEADVIDEVSWASADPDISYARSPDATGDFERCSTPTCGASNGHDCSGP